mmetsp:Transcript_17730/g.55073  ORF Transcript_17730/g.55073 Transcript_17730/m.55073 type:complete len:306 (+) Transcript_17730:1216-2133(+)
MACQRAQRRSGAVSAHRAVAATRLRGTAGGAHYDGVAVRLKRPQRSHGRLARHGLFCGRVCCWRDGWWREQRAIQVEGEAHRAAGVHRWPLARHRGGKVLGSCGAVEPHERPVRLAQVDAHEALATVYGTLHGGAQEVRRCTAGVGRRRAQRPIISRLLGAVDDLAAEAAKLGAGSEAVRAAVGPVADGLPFCHARDGARGGHGGDRRGRLRRAVVTTLTHRRLRRRRRWQVPWRGVRACGALLEQARRHHAQRHRRLGRRSRRRHLLHLEALFTCRPAQRRLSPAHRVEPRESARDGLRRRHGS